MNLMYSVVVAATGAIAALPSPAAAHGFVGQRFFPATIATDDPFVSDELSLPTMTWLRSNATDDSTASHQTTLAVDFSKRVTQDFGLSFGRAHERLGYDNLEVGAKYQFYKNEASETLVSAGVVWEVGGTGSKSVADSFSTFTPTLYFGKGFGDVKSAWLRPLAVTGTLGAAIPGHGEPHLLQIGAAFEYSIPYLQSSVKDVGWGAPWNRMIPVVEIAAQRPIDRADDRRWTGSVNPGVLWAGRTLQLGLEAVVPINRASGRGVGVQAQLHFFIDDIFPRTFGRPLIGGT